MKGLDIDIEGTTCTLEIKVLMRFLKELIKTLQASESTYDLEAYLGLIEKIVKFATQTLIEKGFIPGQDFSANPAGRILIKRKVNAALMEKISAFDCLLI